MKTQQRSGMSNQGMTSSHGGPRSNDTAPGNPMQNRQGSTYVKVGAAYRHDVHPPSGGVEHFDEYRGGGGGSGAASRQHSMEFNDNSYKPRHAATMPAQRFQHNDSLWAPDSAGGQGEDARVAAKEDAERVNNMIQQVAENMSNDVEDDDVTVPRGSWLISPSSEFAKFWDYFTAVLLLFTATITPFDVAFLEVKMDALFWLNRFVHLGFVVDTVITFFMPYQNENNYWIMDRGMIVKKYLSSWFIIDLVSIIPFDLIGYLGDDEGKNIKTLQLLRLLRLFKLLRVLRAGRFVHRLESSMAVNYSMLTLSKFVLVTISLAHWLACGWHMVRVVEDNPAGDWVSNYEAANPSVSPLGETWTRYLVSLYWSVATLSTLGYGDVIPTTDAERAYVVVSSLVGASVYAYMVGNVCGIVANMDKDSGFYMMMDELNMFMHEKQIPQALRKNLRLYFRFKRKVNEVRDWQLLVDHMSPSLRQQVVQHVHAPWVKTVRIFQQASEGFITEVAMLLKTETLSPHEAVVKAGEDADRMYIVEKGLLYVSMPGRIVTSGDVIGEDMMYRNIKRAYSITTLSHALLLVLFRDDLGQLLERHPEERARIRKIVVRIKFTQGVRDFTARFSRRNSLNVTPPADGAADGASAVGSGARGDGAAGSGSAPPLDLRVPSLDMGPTLVDSPNASGGQGMWSGPAKMSTNALLGHSGSQGSQSTLAGSGAFDSVVPAMGSSADTAVAVGNGPRAARVSAPPAIAVHAPRDSSEPISTPLSGEPLVGAGAVLFGDQVASIETVSQNTMEQLMRATVGVQRAARRFLKTRRLRRIQEGKVNQGPSWAPVESLLRESGLEDLIDLFRREGIDAKSFPRLTPCYLRQVGVTLGQASILLDEAERIGLIQPAAGCDCHPGLGAGSRMGRGERRLSNSKSASWIFDEEHRGGLGGGYRRPDVGASGSSPHLSRRGGPAEGMPVLHGQGQGTTGSAGVSRFGIGITRTVQRRGSDIQAEMGPVEAHGVGGSVESFRPPRASFDEYITSDIE